MKQFIAILLFSFLFNCEYSFAKISLKWGKTYYGGEIKVNRVNFLLPDGEWLLVGIDEWSVKGITYKGVTFVNTKENVFKEIVEFAVLNSYGQFITSIDDWMQGVFFAKDTSSDGCYEKPEYYLVKRKKRGSALNCFIIKHEDVSTEIFSPDFKLNGWIKSFNKSYIRKWATDNNITIPKTMLTADHYFYAKSVGNHIATISHSVNPELTGGPKTLYKDEVRSEYNKSNIEKFPKAKKYMQDFIKEAVQDHIVFEKYVKSKEDFKLDFDDLLITGATVKKNDTEDIINQIKELNNLLNDGILTKDEFIKAKEKILN